ncbi:MAG TPA: glycosyltransferase family 4 protein, partial [Dongiaceae bacterium]|nr:glycosyltransferase family 4 protein [Dongiaceae bacterium]
LWVFLLYSILSCWWALVLPADVVVASSGPITVGVPGLLAHWLRRKPLIFEVRDLWPEGAIQTGMLRAPWAIALARWFERLCYQHATTVVALSPGMAAGILQVAPGTHVETISNAADLDLFHPGHPVPDTVRREANGRFVVLYAGTLGRANGTTELVDIACELARRGARDVDIVVIGDGAERAEMERLARQRGLDRLRFLGKLPKTDVAAWHEVAALTLCLFKPFPVTGTCSPNKLFDSLAAGRPVVNNTNGWMAEMLARTGSGLSYTAGDVSAAADLILSLRDNAPYARAMGDAARATAERDYARDRLAAAFAELFPR